MAKTQTDIAKEFMANMLMQVIGLQAELEQVKEELETLKKEKESGGK